MSKEKEAAVFDEKQFLGLNRHTILRRLLMAVFCFTAYYWSQNPKPVRTDLFRLGEYPGNTSYGQLFFLLGIAILVFSGLLLIIMHMRTRIYPEAIVIEGIWSARRVRIELGNITSARPVRLKPSVFNRPVYNLHSRGRVRFYTHGIHAVELTTAGGLVYRIGTQRPIDLIKSLTPYIGGQANPASGSTNSL